MRQTLAPIILLLACLPLTACGIPAFFGLVAANAERTGDHLEEAEYTDLDGKSFAVIVAADRAIQADHPRIVARLTTKITEDIIANTKTTGFVQPAAVLAYQYNNPSWVARAYSEVADEFECDRLIVIDLQEYRLHDLGNSYLWKGQAAATVAVLERDAPLPDDFAYTKFIQVAFPTDQKLDAGQVDRIVITSELSRRLAQRIAWLFYDKDVPNAIDY